MLSASLNKTFPSFLFEKSSPCSDGSGFPLSLSEWSFTIICLTPYNRIKNVLSASLNKTFHSYSKRVAHVVTAAAFLSLSEWSFTICPTPYNRIKNVLSASLNKTFPSYSKRVAHVVAAAGFLSRYLNGPTLYNRIKMC